MPGAVVELVVTDRIEVVPAPALITFQFSAHQRQNFIKFLGRFDGRVHQSFDLRIDAARLLQKPKGEFGAQSERILPVDPAPWKRQLNVLPHGPLMRNARKVYRAGKNVRRSLDGGLFFRFLIILAHEQYRKRRHRLLRIVELGDRHDRPPGKDVLGQFELDVDAAQHQPGKKS